MKYIRKPRALASMCVSLSMLAAGCGTPRPSVITASQSLPPREMTFQCGDELEVNFFGAPELNMTQTIRRDGQISLRLVGDVPAAGRTPAMFQEALRERYGTQLQIKDITVILRKPAPVMVSGAVRRTGPVPLTRPMTVLDAVTEAGGFDDATAEPRAVVLIRQHDGSRKSFVFDFSGILAGRGEDRTFYVEPYDIIHVPTR